MASQLTRTIHAGFTHKKLSRLRLKNETLECGNYSTEGIGSFALLCANPFLSAGVAKLIASPLPRPRLRICKAWECYHGLGQPTKQHEISF